LYVSLFVFVLCYFIVYFFFFQAEDGIRDPLVTGVQTCALPISRWSTSHGSPVSTECNHAFFVLSTSSGWSTLAHPKPTKFSWRRSEERRVGKECRSKWGREV